MSEQKTYTVVIVGATGLVGQGMIQVLEDRGFPVGELRLAASERSMGKSLTFRNEPVELQLLNEAVFQNADIALFAVDAPVSAEWVPVAARHCGVVIDNSSHFRMNEDVPLVVPEVNPNDIFDYKTNIIANPNCSTIQMVAALKPIWDTYGLQRIIVSTYQAASGAGQPGVDHLRAELRGENPDTPAFPHSLLANPIPHISSFNNDGLSKEELKMIHETRKIFHDDSILVSPTCVRVPIMNCHAESIVIETAEPYELGDVRSLLSDAPNIVVIDDVENAQYPLPSEADGKDEVFVGRLRRDAVFPNGLAMWVVADNVRKGAATNAVQIAEQWVQRKHTEIPTGK
ncbi:MAG: aspartate-semialdehyde dehydrogenase [Ectothiorhodospiraceae bacterium]|nr:aspartate-semialdehyde dehydrogenase [Ectothiorhodospiraceae bacterium]